MTGCNAELEAGIVRQLAGLLPVGARGGARIIGDGDAGFLTPGEAAQCATAVARVRNQRGAARQVARRLLAGFGHRDPAILRGPGGAPGWPEGMTGSLSHDDSVALAAVARLADIGSLGIDVEPPLPLPAELIGTVARTGERPPRAEQAVAYRLLFAVKEAVYKASYPLAGTFLDFHDVATDAATRMAWTPDGRAFSWRCSAWPRAVAVAWARA